MRHGRALLLATTIITGLATTSGFAFAQTSAPTPPSSTDTTAPKDDASEVQGVTVTGSRLRNQEFSSTAPIQVITGEESTLRGFVDTAQIIQQATVAGNATQINNNFSGYVVNGGPGVNTVSLRGLGTDRTLVLIDGKRTGPSGTQGAISSVDLNVIPASIIDRVEIIKDGSSSIYGSDAVAGIVNVITKKNYSGGDLSVTAKPTFGGGGDTGDITGSYGKTMGHGYLSGSFDIYRQDSLHLSDRSYTDCVQDFAYNPTTGQRLDLINAATGKVKCQNILGGLVLDGNTGYRYTVTPGTAATLISPTNLTRVNCTIYSTGLCRSTAGATIDVNATRLNRALQPTEDNPAYLQSSAVSPVRRYTATLSGGYDILPKALTVYGDFLYNKRESNQESYRQVFTYLFPTNPSNPLLALGHYGEPVVITPFGSKQDVDYMRGVVGVKGELPSFKTLKNWHYDVSAQFSRSDGSYSSDIILADRFNATTGPTACNVNFANPYVGGPTMAQQEPGVACQPINWSRATQGDGFTADEKSFLTGNDTGHTVYEQAYIEGDFGGDLFELPAGAVSTDLGFHVRRDRINDVPGPQSLAGNSWGLATSGITRGAQNVQEGFAEIGVPVLRDLPFVKSLTFDLSGRYSHYDLSGDSKTYKAAVNWRITSWLALKYDQGTSFRAPALYELFLANQQGYYGQLGTDPCIMYATANANIQKNCAAQGIAPDYAGNGPSILVSSGGGGKALKPETSFAKTVGIALTPRLFGVDLGAEVDYYENTISDSITQFGPGNILFQCYSQPTFPNGYCSLFQRDNDPASPTYQNILTIQNNYLNVGQIRDRGIDLTLRFAYKLPYDVSFHFNSLHSWTLQNSTQLLPGTVTDYNGTVGNPRYVGNADFRFDWRSWTVDWFVNMVGPTSDSYYGTNTTTNYAGTGQPAVFIEKTGFYAISNLTVRKKFENGLTAEIGVSNLFDRKPPVYTDQGFEGVIGQTPLSSQYDLFGRSLFVQVQKTF